jgi:2-polyprenyl-3-methyl-5-hydroxy-6-metoxy-1,4-benzoquinol methylase
MDAPSDDTRLEPTADDLDDVAEQVLDLVGGSKRVLEVGCGHGELTRKLVDRANAVVAVEADRAAAEQAQRVAERVVLADLDQVELPKAIGDDRFDVVLLAGVLERLRDPLAVLRAAAGLVVPHGYVVLSLANVAHIDLRLAHLAGRWGDDVRGPSDTALIDPAQLRFFTRQAMRRLVRDAGLHVAELRLVHRPAFASGTVRRESQPPDLVTRLLAEPDAETYRFVAKLVDDDADAARDGALEQLARLQDLLLATEVRLATAQAQRDVAQAQLAAERAHVQALLDSKTYRLTAPLRRAYASVRSPRPGG